MHQGQIKTATMQTYLGLETVEALGATTQMVKNCLQSLKIKTRRKLKVGMILWTCSTIVQPPQITKTINILLKRKIWMLAQQLSKSQNRAINIGKSERRLRMANIVKMKNKILFRD